MGSLVLGSPASGRVSQPLNPTISFFAAVVSQGINEWKLRWLHIILVFYSEIEVEQSDWDF